MGIWGEALKNYSYWFGWTELEPGQLRSSALLGFYCLPRVADNVESLAVHIKHRLAGECIACGMPGDVHKMDCYHVWRIRDDLIGLGLWTPRLDKAWEAFRSEPYS